MRRRNFLSVLGGAAAWPVAARAQQGERMRRIGILFGGFAADDPEPQARMAAFRQTLQQFGWVDGRNIRIDYRIGGPEAERVRRHALDLISLTPDLIVANSNAALVALQKETRAIPIVFVNVADPVATGSAVSLANPGGNITGFSNFEGSMGGKWLELLKEIAPSITRVAVAHDTASPIVVFRKSIESAGSSFSLQLTFVSVHNFAEIEAIIAEFGRDTSGALVFPGGSVAAANRKLLTQLTAQHHLPTIYGFGYFPRMGGLMSYGVDGVEQWRRASSYVDRILRGAKPSDLPVQLPTKFELIINLKAANALGLDVPPTLLARADEVIE